MNALPVWIPEVVRFSVDANSGAEVEQLTSEPVTSMNIYPEQRFASADGTRIAISRKPFGQPNEIWVCDTRSLRLCRITQGEPLGANPTLNALYFTTTQGSDSLLMRLDLLTLSTREMFRFSQGNVPKCGAVSTDERWFVGGAFAVRDNLYSLTRIDLQSGQSSTLCEIQDMFNPHLQFDPSGSGQCIVQINRSGRMNLVTGGMALTGPMGATLCTVHVESGKITELPIGRPHTPAISGHECWVGKSGRFIFTAAQYKVSTSSFVTLKEPSDAERDMPRAAIYSVAPGDSKAKVVAQGLLFNHVAASDDGRFFIADDHTTGRIYIGSINTGKYLPLCESYTRQGTSQYSHVHAYMTPDNQYVIFNSIVTGVAQVYAARVPEGLLERVLHLT